MILAEIKEKYIRIKCLAGKWNTYLQIDHQGFCICEQTTKKRAIWFGDMLAIALQRLLAGGEENERNDP